MAVTTKQATLRFGIIISIWLFHVSMLLIINPKKIYIGSIGFYIVITANTNGDV